MTLDELIGELQTLRTGDGRGLVSVTATEAGADQLRPVLGVEHREVDGAVRITLTIGAP